MHTQFLIQETQNGSMTLFTIDDSQICERTLNIICNFVEMLHQVPHKLKTQCVKYIVMHKQFKNITQKHQRYIIYKPHISSCQQFILTYEVIKKNVIYKKINLELDIHISKSTHGTIQMHINNEITNKLTLCLVSWINS